MTQRTRDSRSVEDRLQNQINRLRFGTQVGSGGSGFSALIPVHYFAVYLTDDVGNVQPSVPLGHFTLHLDRFYAGVLGVAPETATITEISGGQYKISITPGLPGMSYRLRIKCLYNGTDEGVVTPSEITFVSFQVLS